MKKRIIGNPAGTSSVHVLRVFLYEHATQVHCRGTIEAGIQKHIGVDSENRLSFEDRDCDRVSVAWPRWPSEQIRPTVCQAVGVDPCPAIQRERRRRYWV